MAYLSMQVLASIYFQGGLPFSFMKLKTLDIFAYGLKRYDIPGLLCLFKSSPVVDTLKIMICPKTTNEVKLSVIRYIYISNRT